MHGTLPESGKWPAIPAAKKVRRGRTLLPFQSNGRLIEEETQYMVMWAVDRFKRNGRRSGR